MIEILAIAALTVAVYFAGFQAGRLSLRQSLRVTGSGNVAIQSGCRVGGDLVGGDLIINGKRDGQSRCQHCGAAR